MNRERPSQPEGGSEDYQLVFQLIEYLEGQPQQAPDVAGIAAALGLGVTELEALVQGWCGMDSRQIQQCLSAVHIRAMLGKRKESRGGAESFEPIASAGVEIQAASDGQAEREYGFLETPFGRLLVLRRIGGGISYAAFCEHGDTTAALSEAERQLSISLIRERPLAPEQFAEVDGVATGEALLLQPEGSDFRIRVWRGLTTVRPGEVISYRQLAEMIDCPTGVRAVASAVARNSVACLIPCHRVVLGDGRVGQYRWGPMRKRAMLVWEQARTQPCGA